MESIFKSLYGMDIYITEKIYLMYHIFLFNFPIIALKICCLLWQRMCIELFDEKYKCIWSWLYLLYFQLSFTYLSIECKSLALIQKLCLPVSSHVGNFFYLPVATHGYRPSTKNTSKDGDKTKMRCPPANNNDTTYGMTTLSHHVQHGRITIYFLYQPKGMSGVYSIY